MTRSDPGTRGLSIVVVLIISTIIAWGIFLILKALSIPKALPCTHPSAQSLVLALSGLLILHWIAGAKFFPRSYWYFLAVDTVLILLTFWLGAYAYSPLKFSELENPVLREFVVITRESGKRHIAPDAIITLGGNSIAYIQPVLPPGNTRCMWNSLHGGALDGQDSCNVLYTPPAAEYDILKVNIQPGCGLASSVEQIRISILP